MTRYTQDEVTLLYQKAIFSLVSQETRDAKDAVINGNLAEKLSNLGLDSDEIIKLLNQKT